MSTPENICAFCDNPAYGKSNACKKCLDELKREQERGSPSVKRPGTPRKPKAPRRPSTRPNAKYASVKEGVLDQLKLHNLKTGGDYINVMELADILGASDNEIAKALSLGPLRTKIERNPRNSNEIRLKKQAIGDSVNQTLNNILYGRMPIRAAIERLAG